MEGQIWRSVGEGEISGEVLLMTNRDVIEDSKIYTVRGKCLLDGFVFFCLDSNGQVFLGITQNQKMGPGKDAGVFLEDPFISNE